MRGAWRLNISSVIENAAASVKRWLLLFLALCLYGTVWAQTATTTQGTEFYVSFMPNQRGVTPTLKLVASAARATTVKVYPSSGGAAMTFSVPAGGINEITVSSNNFSTHADANYIRSDKSLRVVASDTISLYASNRIDMSADANNVLPLQALGSKYMVMSYFGISNQCEYRHTWRGGYWDCSAADATLLIVATENNTRVKITPRNAAGTGYDADKYVTLSAGQTYLYASTGDITGTIVEAEDCKKIAVFSGHQRTAVGIENPDSWRISDYSSDHLVEQMLPLNSLGREFVLIPTLDRNEDRYRVMAVEDNTTFTVGGVSHTLNSGAYYEGTISGNPVHILSDKPLAVCLFPISLGAPEGKTNGVRLGDNSMIWVNPVEQTLEDIIFATLPTEKVNSHYVNILVNTTAVALTTLDGADISAEFQPVPGKPAFSYARIGDIADDVAHRLQNPNGLSAYVYGYGEAEVYGYTAGSSVKDLTLTLNSSGKNKEGYHTNFVLGGVNENITVTSWQIGSDAPIPANGATLDKLFDEAGCRDVTVSYVQANNPCADTQRITFPGAACIKPADLEVDSVFDVCEGDTVIDMSLFKGGANGVGELRWYKDSTTSSYRTTSPISPFDAVGEHTFYVSQFRNGVESDRVKVPVYIKPRPTLSGVSDTIICEGMALTLNAQSNGSLTWYDSAGTKLSNINVLTVTPTTTTTYLVSSVLKNGCTVRKPVVVTVETKPLPKFAVSNDTAVCEGQSVTLSATSSNGGTVTWSTPTNIVNPSVTTDYIATAVLDICVAYDTVRVTVKPHTSRTIDTVACDSITLFGTTYTASGSRVEHLTNAAGCDSTLTINFTVNKSTAGKLTRTVCDSVTINNFIYSSSGTYTQHLENAAGCDSTLTIELTVNKAAADTVEVTTCESSYTFNGNTYKKSGTYVQKLQNAKGCDSTLTLILTINKPTSYTIDTTVCESFTLNDVEYASTGYYEQYLTNAKGCDSTIYLNLTVNAHPKLSLKDVEICEGESLTLKPESSTTGSTITWNTVQTTVVPTADTSYIATATLNGCQTSDTMRVVVNKRPTLEVVQDTFVCLYGSIKLTAYSNGTVTWTDNLTTWNDSSITVKPEETTTYWVTARNAKCEVKKSVRVRVEVQPLPKLSVLTPAVVCEGATFEAVSDIGTVVFQRDGNANQNHSVVPHRYGKIIYAVVATSSFGCTTQKNYEITVVPQPALTVMQDTAICLGESITLFAMTDKGLTPAWSSPATVVSPATRTAYTVSATRWVNDSLSCVSDTLAVTISVKPLPVLTVMKDAAIYVGDSIMLRASATPEEAVVSWNVSPTLQAPSLGQHTYTATATLDGCTVSKQVGVYANRNPQSIGGIKDITKTYGDASFTIPNITTSAGFPVVSYSLSSDSVVQLSGNTVTILGAGSVLVTASHDGGNTHVAASTTFTITVNKAKQTLIAPVIPVKYYDDTASFSVAATSSFGLTPILYSIASGNAVTLSGSTATVVAVGSATIRATQAGDKNHTAAAVEYAVEVIKANQSITPIKDIVKTYGDDDFVLSTTAASGLEVSYSLTAGRNVVELRGDSVKILSAGVATVTISQGGNKNYNAAPEQTFTITVRKADQSIKVIDNITKTYGDGDFTLSTTATSKLPVAYSVPAKNGVVELSGSSVKILGAGVVTVTILQGGNENYNAAPEQTFTITVNKAAQSILPIENITKTYGDDDFALSTTATSGLEVLYSVTANNGVVNLRGDSVEIVGVGVATVTVSQGGNENYNAAPEQTFTITVNKADQSILPIADIVKTYLDEPFDLATTATSGLLVSYSVPENEVANLSGNRVEILNAGVVTVTISQGGNDKYNAAPEQAFTITVNKADQSITPIADIVKTYGDEAFDLNTTATSKLAVSYSVPENDVINLSGNRVEILNAGVVTVTISQGGNKNYNAAQDTTFTITVNKAAQSIDSLADITKTYGDEDFYLNATALSKLPVSYTVTAGDTDVVRLDGNRVSILSVGSLTVSVEQQGNRNYHAAPVQSFTITVVRANQAITVADVEKEFDDSAFYLTAKTSSGLPVTFAVSAYNGIVNVDSSSLAEIVGVGTVQVVAEQVGSRLYNPVNDTFTITVNRIKQQISAYKIYKTYGDEDFVLHAYARVSSGLPLTYRVASGSDVIAVKKDTVATILNAGSTLVEILQAGNAFYSPASATVEVEVERKAQVIDAIPDVRIFYDEQQLALYGTSSSGLPVSFEAEENNGVLWIDSTLANISGVGKTTVTAVQPGNRNYLPDYYRFTVEVMDVPPHIIIHPMSHVGTTGYGYCFNVVASGTNLQYQWYYNGEPIMGATDKEYCMEHLEKSNAGEYYVIVSNAAGADTSREASLIIYDVDEILNMTKVYPNPTRGIATVENENLVMEEIIVRDGSGNSVYRTLANGSVAQIDVTNVPSGFYFLTIKTDKGTVIKRVMKIY